MTDPTVCAVMLTRDRPEMARRAVECFREQTYGLKSLVIWDTSAELETSKRLCVPDVAGVHYSFYGPQAYSIGALRNHAIAYGAAEIECMIGEKTLTGPPDIIIHWDDDDWSHPNRIAEQVAMLQSSDVDCVGYREMLFYDDRRCPICFDHQTCTCGRGNAWLYADAYRPVGTSLCYWRRTWERHPFPDLPQPHRQPNPDMRGEDVEWLRGVSFKAVELACGAYHAQAPETGSWIRVERSEPRMIARIHSGNSSGSYAELGKSVWWRRVPAWDAYCQARMTL